jgi:hypothetical protein
MSRYLDPKNDLIFKKIFGHHPDLLKRFLNAVLPLPQDCVIEKTTYLTPESVPELQEFKNSIRPLAELADASEVQEVYC